MKVLLEFPTHHYWREVDKTNYFCPSCGKKNVWIEAGMGDYYCGPSHWCVVCGIEFSLPNLSQPSDQDKMIVEQIRLGKTLEAKTPHGN